MENMKVRKADGKMQETPAQGSVAKIKPLHENKISKKLHGLVRSAISQSPDRRKAYEIAYLALKALCITDTQALEILGRPEKKNGKGMGGDSKPGNWKKSGNYQVSPDLLGLCAEYSRDSSCGGEKPFIFRENEFFSWLGARGESRFGQVASAETGQTLLQICAGMGALNEPSCATMLNEGNVLGAAAYALAQIGRADGSDGDPIWMLMNGMTREKLFAIGITEKNYREKLPSALWKMRGMHLNQRDIWGKKGSPVWECTQAINAMDPRLGSDASEFDVASKKNADEIQIVERMRSLGLGIRTTAGLFYDDPRMCARRIAKAIEKAGKFNFEHAERMLETAHAEALREYAGFDWEPKKHLQAAHEELEDIWKKKTG